MSTTVHPVTSTASRHPSTDPDISLTSAFHTFETIVFTTAIALLLAAGPSMLAWWVVQASSRSNDLFLDLVAAVTVATSTGAWIRVRRPGAPIRRFALVPVAVQRGARHIFERSAFGVGRLGGWTSVEPDHGLSLVRAPESLHDMGPGGRLDARRSGQPVEESTVPTRAAPLSNRAAIATPTFRSVEHVVARGESFWSLAEQRLGDGRRWTEIRDLNIDREVAPGVVLSERTTPLVGHRILVPDISAPTTSRPSS